jgi:hypothetical protein
MITFHEINSTEIKDKYPTYFHKKARYFNIAKNNNNIGYYGVISYDYEVCEAFLMFKSFKGKVLSKEFFLSLFEHLYSLGYREVLTWTKWDKLIKLFSHFTKFGIYKTRCPAWDNDPSKTWYIMRT